MVVCRDMRVTRNSGSAVMARGISKIHARRRTTWTDLRGEVGARGAGVGVGEGKVIGQASRDGRRKEVDDKSVVVLWLQSYHVCVHSTVHTTIM